MPFEVTNLEKKLCIATRVNNRSPLCTLNSYNSSLSSGKNAHKTGEVGEVIAK